tara:strand:- start:2815 stop:3069 length:255 start_codon:yes stop_codon:yes gene_type:complete
MSDISWDVQVGDLVKITDWRGGLPDDRKFGTILSFDHFRGLSGKIIALDSYDPQRAVGIPEVIAEVLWNTGKIEWILKDRLGTV